MTTQDAAKRAEVLTIMEQWINYCERRAFESDEDPEYIVAEWAVGLRDAAVTEAVKERRQDEADRYHELLCIEIERVKERDAVYRVLASKWTTHDLERALADAGLRPPADAPDAKCVTTGDGGCEGIGCMHDSAPEGEK